MDYLRFLAGVILVVSPVIAAYLVGREFYIWMLAPTKYSPIEPLPVIESLKLEGFVVLYVLNLVGSVLVPVFFLRNVMHWSRVSIGLATFGVFFLTLCLLVFSIVAVIGGGIVQAEENA